MAGILGGSSGGAPLEMTGFGASGGGASICGFGATGGGTSWLLVNDVTGFSDAAPGGGGDAFGCSGDSFGESEANSFLIVPNNLVNFVLALFSNFPFFEASDGGIGASFVGGLGGALAGGGVGGGPAGGAPVGGSLNCCGVLGPPRPGKGGGGLSPGGLDI